ncbi:MAG: SGNH/GDSL hydrolase family protein [Betaproteobacteria bacterium]|nr:MAG: SGNH/GDSL hydrolase family protein [Betaproteobacteria bacterium]
MSNILSRIIRVGVLALVMLAPASPALGGAPHRFVVFGDSLSDPGNAFVLLRDAEIPPFDSLIPDAPYARGAFHFSNGPTWVEQLSLLDHAVPSAGPALFIPLLFSNYAVGGARARPEGPFDLSTQVGLFVRDFRGQGPSGALYIVFAGGNDLRDALQALALDRSGATSAAIVQAALTAIRDNLLTLYAAGARHFLVPNAPDIGLAPAVRLLGPAAQGAATFFAAQFNGRLELILRSLEASLGVGIVRLDVFRTLNEIVAAPGAFGLTEVTQPCIALNTQRHAFCASPGEFLFWDGIHPTVAGHRILAERADAALGAASALAVAP